MILTDIIAWVLCRKELNMSLGDYLANRDCHYSFDKMDKNPQKHIRNWRFLMKQPQIFFEPFPKYLRINEETKEHAKDLLGMYERVFEEYHNQFNLSYDETRLIRNKINFTRSLLGV